MSLAGQALRYAAVGLVNTGVGLGVILGAMAAGAAPVPANAAGYAVGLGVSFLLNRRWTFRSDAPWRGQVAPFAAVMAAAYGANLAVLTLLIGRAGAAPALAQVAGVAVYAACGFLGLRLLVFARGGPGRRRLAAVLALAAVALAGVATWQELRASPLVRVPMIDERHYLVRAQDVAEGRLVPDGPFYMSPLYPYLVWATGSARPLDAHGVVVGGPGPGIRILQAGLWCATALLLWRAARRMLPARAAWVPPALFVLYRPLAALAATTLLEVPYTFCAVAVLVLATSDARGRRRWLHALAAGLLLGTAALLRGVALVLAVALVAGWWRRDGGLRRALPPLAAAAAVAALVMLPAAAHNTRAVGRPAGPSLNAGIVLYAGNGPRATGYQVTGRAFHFDRDPSGAGWLKAATGREATGAAAVDRAWREEALAVMAADPARTLRLWAKKVWLQVMGAEIPNVTPLDAWARHSTLLAVLVVPYGLIAALGLAGLALAGWRRGPARAWTLAGAALVAAQALFFVVSRYRMVLVPILALGAGLLVAEVLRRRGRALVVPLALAALAALAVQPWGQRGTLRGLEAAALANEGARWQALGSHQADRGEAAAARASWRRSVDLLAASVARAPDANAARKLARSQAALGDHHAARRTLDRALAAAPAAERAALRRDRVLLALEAGDTAGALAALADYLPHAPDDLEMRHVQVLLLDRAGRLEEALAVAADTVARHPDDVRGHRDLGRLLARSGRLEEARRVLADARRRFPGDEQLAALLQATREAR